MTNSWPHGPWPHKQTSLNNYKSRNLPIYVQNKVVSDSHESEWERAMYE